MKGLRSSGCRSLLTKMRVRDVNRVGLMFNRMLNEKEIQDCQGRGVD